MGKRKVKNESKYIEIYLAIYRCAVLVTWEQNFNKIITKAKKRGVSISKTWGDELSENSKNAQGVCMNLGDNNTDVLVWLKKRPVVASDYGVLYHELFHAVDAIAESHNLINEREGRAFIFEYLTNKCNQVLWQ